MAEVTYNQSLIGKWGGVNDCFLYAITACGNVCAERIAFAHYIFYK